MLWCPVFLAKLRLLLSSSFFPKRAIGIVSTDLGSWIALLFQFNFFDQILAKCKVSNLSLLFIPIQQKNWILLSTVNARPMTCWTHSFAHSNFYEFFNGSKRYFFFICCCLFFNIMYFLQKDDIMLHFTLNGIFRYHWFVYLESVTRYKFGFTWKVLRGINLDLDWI